jgi:hypothetical protein
MAAVTVAQVETGLTTALQLAQDLAPLAALGGPSAAAVGAAVAQAAAVAEAVVPQVLSDAEILRTGDPAQIKALQAQLQTANAALAAQIAAL